MVKYERPREDLTEQALGYYRLFIDSYGCIQIYQATPFPGTQVVRPAVKARQPTGLGLQ